MAYEIEFIGVSAEKASKDADAICIRWKDGIDVYGRPIYKIGVVDGGFEAHGDAMVRHMNQYYFDDKSGDKGAEEKNIEFIVVTHPDLDHISGIKKVLENFSVKSIYMNRPWIYVDDLFDKVNDGRITKNSLKETLREKYKTLADIEDIAIEKGVQIFTAFQGQCIEDRMLILSPSKQFYLDLLVESEKTPLEDNAAKSQTDVFIRIAKQIKKYVLNVLENWNIETLRENVETSAENETSVVIRGSIEGAGFLLTGDAGIRALTEAMDYMDSLGEDIRNSVSFYQIPHHGGRHNISPSVLDRMLGEKLRKGESRNKTACASVAKDSDHPLKMVTNAYIRRGVKPIKTDGGILRHPVDMPDRGWDVAPAIAFSDYVEEWDE